MPSLLLSDAFLKAIKPPQRGRVDYIDTRVPSLTLRVHATGTMNWTFRYTALGSTKKRRAQLGDYPRVTLTRARAKAEAIRVRSREGADPVAEREAVREQRRKEERGDLLTFGKLIDIYLADLKTRKDSWKQDEGYLLRDARPFWCDTRPASITREDCATRLLAVKARAPVAANRVRSALKSLFAWAVGQGLLASSPMDGIAKPTREKKGADDIRALSDAELVLLLKSIEQARLAPGIVAAFKVLALTGQRPAEIAGLALSELRHINSASEALFELPPERVKTRRRHAVPLVPVVAAIIREQIAQQAADASASEFVFASRFSERQNIARHSLSQAMRRVIDGLDTSGPGGAVARGLQADRPTPHAFRRTMLTGMARLRIPREDRKAVVGHKEDDVLAGHYDAYDRLDEKRTALAAWARHVTELLSGTKSTGVVVPLVRGAAR